MSSSDAHNPDRLDQLMVDAATQGLSPQDEAELSAAIGRHPAMRLEAEAYELAVAAVEMALARPDESEPLPDAMRAALLRSASSHLPKPAEPEPLKLAGTPAERSAPQPKPGFSWTDGRAFGWYAAAAALIAIAVLMGQLQQVSPITPPMVDRDNPAQSYAELSENPATIKANWGFNTDAGDPRFANATGEVIWNSDKQAGYMKLTGLPVNDPTREQYQLWIVDATRGDETTNRVDGGVFDVSKTGEVIIPINAKIQARQPAAFAITVEQPGGVVVSKGPLQVVAAVENAG